MVTKAQRAEVVGVLQDGEVEDFELLPVQEVARLVRETVSTAYDRLGSRGFDKQNVLCMGYDAM